MLLQGSALNTGVKLGNTKGSWVRDVSRGRAVNNCCQIMPGGVACEENRLGQECINFHNPAPTEVPGFPCRST
jgi:hypothetical protein